jgi:hypothetical protein
VARLLRFSHELESVVRVFYTNGGSGRSDGPVFMGMNAPVSGLEAEIDA